MARKAVQESFRNRILNNYTDIPLTASNPRTSDVPADGSAFLTLQFPNSSERQISVGSPNNNAWREDGSARILISVPLGEGDWRANNASDTLADLFRGKVFDDIEVFAVNGPFYDDENEDGAYYTVALVIVYKYDFFY